MGSTTSSNQKVSVSKQEQATAAWAAAFTNSGGGYNMQTVPFVHAAHREVRATLHEQVLEEENKHLRVRNCAILSFGNKKAVQLAGIMTAHAAEMKAARQAHAAQLARIMRDMNEPEKKLQSLNRQLECQARKQEDLQEANRDLAKEGRARRMECNARKTDLEKQCKANRKLLRQIQALRRERELQKLKQEAWQTRVQAGIGLLCEGVSLAHASADAAAGVAAQGVSLACATAGAAASICQLGKDLSCQGVYLAYGCAGAAAGICQGLLRMPSLLLQPVR